MAHVKGEIGNDSSMIEKMLICLYTARKKNNPSAMIQQQNWFMGVIIWEFMLFLLFVRLRGECQLVLSPRTEKTVRDGCGWSAGWEANIVIAGVWKG